MHAGICLAIWWFELGEGCTGGSAGVGGGGGGGAGGSCATKLCHCRSHQNYYILDYQKYFRVM